ncbi:MAG: AAA family ATPase [Ignavibacteriales bacterium]|nr:AAA family ATPase [Ignavibacteriales bacterium]
MPQHSLEKVWIDGFRGLRNLSLDGLGPLNILVGENNSGKTSVLEALSILCNPYDPSEWLAMVRRRDFGGLDETRVQSLRWCFPQTGELVDSEFMFTSRCEMKCSGAFPLRNLHVEYKDIVGEPSPRDLERLERMVRRRPGTGDALEMEEPWRGAEIAHFVESDAAPNQATLFDSGTHSTIEPIVMQFWEEDRMMGRHYRSQREGNLPTDTLTPYSYQLNRLQVRSHSQQLFSSEADSTRGREYVLELITQFDPDIVDIQIASFRGGRPAIYLNHKRMGPAPLSVFGDALRRAVLLASTLHMLKGGGVLLIDELETGIHVGSLERVFAWLAKAARQFDVQIIATTHSLEAVDAIVSAAGDRIDDLVTFHLDQTGKETQVKRIAADLLLRLRRERGLDVR